MATFAGQTVSGSLSADGPSSSFQPVANKPFNVFITGGFTATVTLQRTYDGGATWLDCSKPDLSVAAFTAATNFVVDEPEAGVLYRVNVASYSGSPVGYRFST